MSTQAIVMSEEVYFNEPGFEGEAGTPDGERKNEGYSNIVKYCNIKYAMLEQLRNPPRGFENVIRAHFYLKRDEIIKDVRKWIDEASVNEALYTGLVSDHNYNWWNKFKTKGTYLKMLTEIVETLEKELYQLPDPVGETLDAAQAIKRKAKAAHKDITQSAGVLSNQDSDEEETIVASDGINLYKEAVTDRFSRYIGALGIEAVAKQAECHIFLSGATAAGIATAKNLVLAGCKTFTLHDTQVVTLSELSGQFFLKNEDIGKNRALCQIKKLQQLNSYVKVIGKSFELPTEDESLEQLAFQKYDVVILCECPIDTAVAINRFCRKRGVKFIMLDVFGPFSKVFNDFGDEFVVLDSTGEQTKDSEPPTPVTLKFKSLKEWCLASAKDSSMLDFNLADADYENAHNWRIYLSWFEALDTFIKGNKRMPRPWDFDDIDLFVEIVQNLLSKLEISMEEDQKKLVSLFSATCSGVFSPLWAFIGGIVAQEAVKAMTQKFSPIRQVFLYSMEDVCPDIDFKDEKSKQLIKANLGSNQDRYQGLRTVIGDECVRKLSSLRVFLVGAGAIGWELLMNYALLGVGTEEKTENKEGGIIIVTDPDHIENSNLNRQFLFREKHIGKPKATTAASAAISMNPHVKGHILARFDKVWTETEDIFSDDFFKGLSVVTTALDNVAARRYIDGRIVQARTPFIDAGTLGPKGNWQVVLPFKTETYSSSTDPEDNTSIPHCTLKLFPTDRVHVIEWAKDLFSSLFELRPQEINKILEDSNAVYQTAEEISHLRSVTKWLSEAPKHFDDWVAISRARFDIHYNFNIKQLLHTYPLDFKTKDGTLFWSPPKKPPHPIEYDPEIELHRQYIAACSCLEATIYGIEIPKDVFNQLKAGQKLSAKAALSKSQEFSFSEGEADAIKHMVEKENNTSEAQEETEDTNTEASTLVWSKEEIDKLAETLSQLVEELKINSKEGGRPLKVEEFEKDNAANFHIDFIHAAANLRAMNYDIEITSWLDVKLIAGKIIPALVTTTAVVAAAQTLNLVRLWMKNGEAKCRNYYFNLALPYIQMSEPGEPKSQKITETLTVNEWTRLEIYDEQTTVRKLIDHIHKTYGLHVRGIMKGNQVIYIPWLYAAGDKAQQEEEILNTKMSEFTTVEDCEYIDVTIVNSQSEDNTKTINESLLVRVYFKQPAVKTEESKTEK